MNFIGQDSRSKSPVRSDGGTEEVDFYAFFDKPTPENLAANRSGILSQPQHDALQRNISDQKNSIAILTGMLIVAAFILSFFFWIIDSQDGSISIEAQVLNAAVILLALGVFLRFFARDWFIFFIGDDLENRVVKTEPGRIEWNGRHYLMSTDDRVLRSFHSRTVLPPPGNYRFYFLPHTGLVVLAEKNVPGQVEDSEDYYLRVLANSNRFTYADLDRNRNGLLSRHQENQLLQVFMLYFLGLFMMVLLFFSMKSQTARAMSPTAIYLLSIVCIFLVLRLGGTALRTLADLWIGKVKSMDGLLVRDVRRSRYADTYYYVMDAYRFQVSRAAYNALIEGKHYRVFYVPHSRRLVSLQPLEFKNDEE